MTHPSPIDHDPDPYACRRVYPRVPVALPAFLQAEGQRWSVQILDLSSGGAKLSCGTGFSAGTRVLLDCGSLACAAVVRWQDGGVLGLSFDDALDPRVVSILMERSQALDRMRKARSPGVSPVAEAGA